MLDCEILSRGIMPKFSNVKQLNLTLWSKTSKVDDATP